LTYITTRYPKNDLINKIGAAFGQNFAWAPMGTFAGGQNITVHDLIVREKAALLAAGFAGGDPEYFDSAMQSIEQQSDVTRMYA